MTPLPLFVHPLHPAFEGHFPSRPIVPGVVLIDEALRAIAAHRAATGAPAAAGPIRIGVAKFLSVVGPGEALSVEIEPAMRRSGQADDGSPCDAVAYRLRILAGEPPHERVALTGDVVFDSGTDAHPATAGST